MFSGSDSFLSTILRHDAPLTRAPMETEGKKLKYFQRMMPRPKQEPISPEEPPAATTVPRETVAGHPGEFPAIPTTYYFADYVLTSERASSETLAFVDVIQQVRQGIYEVERLYLSAAVTNFLDAYPSKRTWIRESLQEAQRTINDIGVDMEAAWSYDDDGGTVASKRKFEWGLKNQKKLLKKQQQLNQCYAQLNSAIDVMQTVDLCSKPGVIPQEPIYEAPVRPWVPHDDRDASRGPYSRQKHRLGHNNPSVSSLNLASEAERDDFETVSVNSIPAELAGSAPSEVSKNQNIQVFLSPQISSEQLTRSSGLLRRPRASSDYVRRNATRGARSRASIDVPTTLAKVADATIDSHDSISSAHATVGIPMIAKRYRATSVDIPKHAEKQKSSTQELPFLSNEPSLIDDLADYVLPNTASERFSSGVYATSSTQSMPSISVTSILTISDVLPAVPETTISADVVTNPTLKCTRGPEDGRNTSEELHRGSQMLESTRRQESSRMMDPNEIREDSESSKRDDVGTKSESTPPSYCPSTISTPRSSCSPISVTFFHDDEPVCRPSSQRPSRRMLKRMSHASKGRSVISATPTIGTAVDSEHRPSAEYLDLNQPTTQDVGKDLSSPSSPTAVEDTSQPVVGNSAETPEDQDNDIVLSLLRQRLQKHTQTKHLAESLLQQPFVDHSAVPLQGTKQPTLVDPVLENPATPTGQLELATTPVPLHSEVAVENKVPKSQPEGTQNDSVGGKSMSAQAKRRAAHARRMQLAFGRDADS